MAIEAKPTLPPKGTTEAPKLAQKEYMAELIRVSCTRAEFMITMPRFYRAFDYVDMYPNEEIETLGVAPIYQKGSKELSGKHDLMWNPNFTAQLSDQQLIGVQMHELLHILLGHTTTRCPHYTSMTINSQGQAQITNKEEQAQAYIWNIATDLAINCMIKNYLVDSRGLQKVGVFPGQEAFATLPEFMTAEFYFHELMKQYQQEMKDLDALIKKLKKMFEDGKIGSHRKWVEAVKGLVKKEGQTKAGAKSKSEIEGDKDGADKDAPTIDEIEKELEEIAEDLGLTAGSSGGTYKTVDLSKGKERKTPGWMKKTTHASVHGFEVAVVATRKVPDRRFGILFPGKKRVAHRNKCIVFVDVSGSISRPLLNKFTEHLNKMKKYADFDLIFFNHSLISVTGKEFSPDQGENCITHWKKGMDFYIGGGTDFEPIFQFWNRVRVKYDACFIFTDGEANYQTPPSRPREVNWVLYASSSWYEAAIKHGNKYNIKEKSE
jgi:predicted metal-dependent peptidase